MTYAVTYRDKSGAKVEVEITAADRAECLAECKSRNISPIAIKEGRASPRQTGRTSIPSVPSLDHKQSKQRTGTPFPLWLAMAAVLFATLGGAWWFWIRAGSRPSSPPVAKPPTVVEEKITVETKKAKYNQGPRDIKERNKDGALMLKTPVSAMSQTNMPPNRQQQQPLNVIAKEKEPEGGIHYRTCTEQILGWIFSCPIGNAPMPLPNLPPKELEHLEEILATPNLPKETDDDFVKEQKLIIQQAKVEFRKFLEEGGKPSEFLNYYHDLLLNYHDQFMDARKAVLKTVREEDPEFAREYLLKVNAHLAEKGIKPIVLSRKFSEKIGIEYDAKEKK